jgi:hypothetical protein
MSVVSRTTLKSYFETGDTPTQAQFANFIDTISNVSNGFILSGSAAVGDTILTVDRPVSPIAAYTGLVLIDPFTAHCEVRKVLTPSGSVFSVNALRYAHSSGVQVLFISDDVIGLCYWGAKDDGSDAEPAIQAAFDEQYWAGGYFWLGGQGKTFRVYKPLMLSSVARIQNMAFQADSTSFSPVDSTNAMIMGSQGYIRTFTVATNGTFTTNDAHGLPGAGVFVMFKNVSGASGLVAGRIYYSRDIDVPTSGTQFKVSATPGGAALTFSTTGSGTAYLEVSSMSRVYMRDITLFGGSGSIIPNLNGMDIVTQQPTDIWKLRINDIDGTGLKLKGQDGVIWNLMLINCRIGLALDTASFFKFYQWNIESCGIGVTAIASGCNLFHGGHIEMGHTAGFSNTTSIVFDLTGFSGIIDSIWVTLTHVDQTFLKSNGGASQVAYDIRGLASSGSVDYKMINDSARGISKLAWTDFKSEIERYNAPPSTTSASYSDEARWTIVGKSGRHIKFGSTNYDKPVLDIQADSDQAAEMLIVRGVAGATIAKISLDGSIEIVAVGANFICKSPDGTRYKLVVANGGALSTTAA